MGLIDRPWHCASEPASPRDGLARGGYRDVFGNLTSVNVASSEHVTISALGSVETSVCPMRSQALKISTIEPHPTRDGVDVVTYWCPIHGNIWTSIVVNQVEVADTKIATLLPSQYEQSGFVWPSAIEPSQGVAKQRNSRAGAQLCISCGGC